MFGGLEFSRRDLMAVNIQRGRDHGLPDYNTAREYYGLERISKWEDINPYYKDNSTDVSPLKVSVLIKIVQLRLK